MVSLPFAASRHPYGARESSLNRGDALHRENADFLKPGFALALHLSLDAHEE